jgi:hypothetical protein
MVGDIHESKCGRKRSHLKARGQRGPQSLLTLMFPGDLTGIAILKPWQEEHGELD